jgi:transcriptional regulator with PAS, ATPase and Fis domain
LSIQTTLDQPRDESHHGRDRTPRPGLVLVYGGGSPQLGALPLTDNQLDIGRETPGLAEDGRISRQHVRVSRSDDGWRVADLGSRNGTWLDGKRVEGEIASAAPMVLRAGDSLFLFHDYVGRFDAPRVMVKDGVVVGPTLAPVWEQIRHAALDGLVLHMTGETGTGKELAARRFHDAGERKKGPFVAVNCAAVPPAIAERLFFGAKKGAYSGADQDAEGYVVAAHEGTLFLDEIGELDAGVQAKLLRVLESREVLPLGASRPRPVSFGLVSATHVDLRQRVAEGKFRQDLYFRLGRPTVALPPLRERREEIPWILSRAAEAEKAPPLQTTFVETVLTRAWPGNVRELLVELKSAISAARRDGRGSVRASHLPSGAGLDVGAAVKEPEESWRGLTRKKVEEALAAEKGNISAAARVLNLHRTQLRRLMERFDLDEE